MSTILDLLKAPFPRPDARQIRIAVARHEAEVWPSPLVTEYARQRSRLLHGLTDVPGIEVVTWGETDGEYPREVVQVVLGLSAAVLPSLATVLTAWISVRPRKDTSSRAVQSQGSVVTAPDSVPGLVIVRPDGTRLEITGRDGLTKVERAKVLTAFIGGL